MRDMIHNQTQIPRTQWRYGFRSSAATGCGWIATHNALQILGSPATAEELIRYFERHFPLVNGNLGTFMPNIAAFFLKKGYHVKITFRRKQLDRQAKENDVSILFYFWHEKYRIGAHYVTIEYRDGQFIGYNTFRNSKGPDHYGPSLEEFIRRQKFHLPILLSIRHKNTK